MNNWEKEFDERWHYSDVEYWDDIKSFIKELLSKQREEVFETERQFILNVLDGIDIADEEMGNKGGGTKAIRLALQSRVSPHQALSDIEKEI